MLTHQVSVSLQERSLCPNCSEDYLQVSDEPSDRTRETLKCFTCDYTDEATFRRWRVLYPRVPESNTHDVFRSLEKLDDEGNVSVEFAVDIDRGGWEAAEKVHHKLVEIAGDVFDVYDSGSKGYHIHLPYEKWQYSNPQWPAVFKQLAENLDILGIVDTAIYMRNGMYRVEGSINTKSGRRKSLLHGGKLTAPNQDWLDTIALAEQQAEAHSPTRYASSGDGESKVFKLLADYVPPCIQGLWLDGLPAKGTRHLSYMHLISYYYRRGDSEDECLENMRDFAETFGENTTSTLPQRLSEVERLTHLAYRQGLTFECQRGQTLGICEVECKLYK